MRRTPFRAVLLGARARATRHLREADRQLDARRFRAVEATSEPLRAAIFRLRHHLYVDVMGVLAPDHPLAAGGMFRDAFDAYSTLLALFYEHTLVGTLRITTSREGPLELETYRCLTPYRRPEQVACEFQRLMILPEYRCVAATRELLVSAIRLAMRRDATQLFGAARVGNLGRLFQNVGAQVLDPAPFRFAFVPGAEYQLIGVDLGEPRSLRRWTIVTGVGMWSVLARHRPRRALRMSRREFAGRS